MSAAEPDRQAARQSDEDRRARDFRDEVDELNWVMSDPRGRRFVWRQVQRDGVYLLSFVQGDPGRVAFNEGRRSVGIALLTQVREHCPEREAEMRKEAYEYERRSTGK